MTTSRPLICSIHLQRGVGTSLLADAHGDSRNLVFPESWSVDEKAMDPRWKVAYKVVALGVSLRDSVDSALRAVDDHLHAHVGDGVLNLAAGVTTSQAVDLKNEISDHLPVFVRFYYEEQPPGQLERGQAPVERQQKRLLPLGRPIIRARQSWTATQHLDPSAYSSQCSVVRHHSCAIPSTLSSVMEIISTEWREGTSSSARPRAVLPYPFGPERVCIA